MRTILRWLLTAACLTGCGAGDHDRSGVAVRDSGGIDVLAVSADALASAVTWHVDSLPAVLIGAAPSPVDDLAGVTAAVRRRDGVIVIGNAMTSEVRIHSPTGELVSSVGRSGDGPGEYRLIWRICLLAADTLGVWDESLRRLTVLAPDGDVVRTHALTMLPEDVLTVRACTGTSWVLVGPEDRYKFRDQNRVRRDTLPLIAFDTRTAALDTIGRFAGEEQYEMEVPPVVLLEPAPFGASTSLAAAGDRLVIGDNGAAEVLVLDTLKVSALLRWHAEAAAVTAAQRAAFRAANLDSTWRPAYLAAKRAFLDEAPVPQRMRQFGQVLLDDADRVWLSDYVPAHEPEDTGREWTVVDFRTVSLARIATPDRFRVMQVGDGWILGIARDADDVELVQLLTYRAPD